MTHFPRLFQPLQVGPVMMKNRIETGPMSIVETDPKGGLTEHAMAFYEHLAAGGAAGSHRGWGAMGASPVRCAAS